MRPRWRTIPEAACPGDGFSGQPEMRRDAEEVA